VLREENYYRLLLFVEVMKQKAISSLASYTCNIAQTYRLVPIKTQSPNKKEYFDKNSLKP
jgi:hypothetical protein